MALSFAAIKGSIEELLFPARKPIDDQGHGVAGGLYTTADAGIVKDCTQSYADSRITFRVKAPQKWEERRGLVD